jgi:hypothetical protein
MMLQDTVPQQLFSLILNHDNPKQVLDAMRECKKFDDFTLNDLTTLLTNNATCQNILYLSKHNALDQYHYGMLVKEQDIQANAAFIYTIGIINRRSYTSSEFIRQTLELTTSCLQKLKHLTQVDDKLIHYIHSVKAPLSYIDSLVKLNNRCGLAIDAGIKRDMALISDPSKMLKVYEYLINSSAASEFECAVLYSCACHYNHIWGDDEVFSRFERIQNGIDKIQFEHLIQLTKRYANDPETAKSVISQELDDILFLREHLLYDEDSYLFSTSYNFFSNLGNQEIDEHFDVSQFLKFDN